MVKMKPQSFTVLLFLLPPSLSAWCQQQREKPLTDEELLARPAKVVGTSGLSVDMAFMMAMDQAQAAGGAVIIHGCEEPSKKVVRYRGSTLREVLDNIVTDDPDYVWEVNDGVVNLAPAKGVPDLLTLRIAAFDSGDATSLVTAGTYLLALPEVRKRAAGLGFSQGVLGVGPSSVPAPGTPLPPPKWLDVHLENVTLFDALNALVRTNGHGQWIYHETHCKSQSDFHVQFSD
jgi:hypothetical protein